MKSRLNHARKKLKEDVLALEERNGIRIHTPASLYKAFPPQEAGRLAERFECHYTPKHSSWTVILICLLMTP